MRSLPTDILAVVKQFVDLQSVPEHVVILKHSKAGQLSKGVLLLNDTAYGAVIVKIWGRQVQKNRLLSLVGDSNARREWYCHRYAFEHKLAVPRPISFGAARCGHGQLVDVMVVQHLDSCTKALPFFKQILFAADETKIRDFEQRLIRTTVDLILAGITDVDHQLNNMLVSQSGEIYRIDFECARRHWFARFREQDLGQMLGRLICSHVYACQPELGRSHAFAQQLIQQLSPSLRSQAIAKETVGKLLERQRQKNGVDSVLVLPW